MFSNIISGVRVVVFALLIVDIWQPYTKGKSFVKVRLGTPESLISRVSVERMTLQKQYMYKYVYIPIDIYFT